jgi:hypothetical protein
LVLYLAQSFILILDSVAVLFVKKLGRAASVLPEYGHVYFNRRKPLAVLQTFQ